MSYLGNVPHLDKPIIKFQLGQEMIEFLYFLEQVQWDWTNSSI